MWQLQPKAAFQSGEFPVYESVLEARIWTALFFRKVTSLIIIIIIIIIIDRFYIALFSAFEQTHGCARM